MLVFLSWSGRHSNQVAQALKAWLPLVINAIEPWLSEEGIPKGKRWSPEISTRLDQARAGIVCLTPSNLNEPWLLFEAGALSKAGGTVCTYLLGLKPTDVPQPLGQFQHTVAADREDNLRLVRDLNRLQETKLTNDLLDEAFNLSWDRKLEPIIHKVSEAIAKGEQNAAVREPEDVLREVLDLTRGIDRALRHRLPTVPPAAPTVADQADALRDYRTPYMRALENELVGTPAIEAAARVVGDHVAKQLEAQSAATGSASEALRKSAMSAASALDALARKSGSKGKK